MESKALEKRRKEVLSVKKKELEFREITAQDAARLSYYYTLRENNTCDSVFMGEYLWKDYFKVRYAVSEQTQALHYIMEIDGKTYAAVPYCRGEYLPAAWEEIRAYFHEELKIPLEVNLADETSMNILMLSGDEYEITELRDAEDYLYDAQALKTLSGKKLHKKKNHLNAFLREQEGHYEYRRLCCSDAPEVWAFLKRWKVEKDAEYAGLSEEEKELDGEILGIHNVLTSCSLLSVRMAGVYIDGVLQAFTLGSYNEQLKMAVIHVEKANPNIRGLYTFINQQFLVNEYEDAVLVNREDDVGIESLRQAKLSYAPVGLAKKFRVAERMHTF